MRTKKHGIRTPPFMPYEPSLLGGGGGLQCADQMPSSRILPTPLLGAYAVSALCFAPAHYSLSRRPLTV